MSSREIDFVEFLKKHGRAPHLSAGELPWQYRGWLGFYVQGHHADPKCSFPDRWGYWFQMQQFARGEGSDPGPIPRIEFNKSDKSVLKGMESACQIIQREGRGFWSSYMLLIDWLAFGLGVETEAPKISEEASEALYRTLDIRPWLEAPYDYLGLFLCETRGSGWNPNAFYPTPHGMCSLMLKLQMGGEPEGRFCEFYDPCVGTGRLPLHASNHSLRIYGQDIDALMVRCTLINAALYAPWIFRNIPELDALLKEEENEGVQVLSV